MKYEDYEDLMETAGEYFDEEQKAKELVKKAFGIASIAHRGQFRDEGSPYLNHPIRVASRFKNDDTLKVIALLHDVIEDSDYSYLDIKELFGEFIAKKVLVLTKDKSKSDFSIDSYMKEIVEDYYALKVKLADRIDNIKSLYLCPDSEKIKKYIKETYMYFIDNEEIKNYNALDVKDLYSELLAEVKNAERLLSFNKIY
ncbi:HD domain-containing protein [Acetoanaerobium noterae]|uniref:HD domain-containing protein n=1 Tax=Acetoanaerobium noterae TaxID=745369 RepID=UPI003221495E